MSSELLLQCSDISVRFGGVDALWEVSLTASSGELLGVVGGNGSGKSTLLDVIGGLVRPTAGTVKLAGISVIGVPAWRIARYGVARVFQAPRVPEDLYLVEAVRFLLGWGMGQSQQRDARLTEALNALGRETPLRRELPLREATFGRKKTVALVAALFSGARILLLDEPFAGLDASGVEAAVEAINRARSTGALIVIVEHHVKRMMAIADRVAVMERGRLVALDGAQSVVVGDALTAQGLG